MSIPSAGNTTGNGAYRTWIRDTTSTVIASQPFHLPRQEAWLECRLDVLSFVRGKELSLSYGKGNKTAFDFAATDDQGSQPQDSRR